MGQLFVKSLQIIIFQALLLLLIACGQNRPRVIQQEGFTLIYDTLNVDVSKVIGLDKTLRLQFALPLEGGYLCAFEQNCQRPQRYLLWANSKTGQTHIVDFPYKNHLYWSFKKRNGAVYMKYPEWCDTMWRFEPEREIWEDASSEMNVVYEDEDYRVYCKRMRYPPYHTWFMDKRTGEQFFFPVATGQVLRFNGYFYFTDSERFRGLADPKVGFLCDSLSSYEAALAEPSGMMPRSLRSHLGEMKLIGNIYAFGEGDDGWYGCEGSPYPPSDTILNASFLAKESLYQIVTDPETSWIAQVTTDGLKRIVNLGKPYDAYHIGQSILLYYEDDGQDAGIIELGDTLHFHHLRIY